VKIRGLNGIELNPKTKLTTEHVYKAYIEKVFGKVSQYKTTNMKLHQDTKKSLLRFCSQIYNTSIVTNDEIMLWVVKGYIAQHKSIDVDWEKVATSTTKKKACHVLMEKMKSSYMEKRGEEMSYKIEGDTMCRSSLNTVGTMAKRTCPYCVPVEEIAMVHGVHSFLVELFKSLEQKVTILEGEAKMFSK
jgi:hypothetical protein